jgi:hypothetical protein
MQVLRTYSHNAFGKLKQAAINLQEEFRQEQMPEHLYSLAYRWTYHPFTLEPLDDVVRDHCKETLFMQKKT